MGRKSGKENRSIYLQTREELNLTRAQASELLNGITETRLEKLENGKYPIHPEEVLLMADKYRKPELCNYYCANECPIGQEYVPEIEIKDLPTITLEMLNTLSSLDEQKKRLVEITVDGKITPDEAQDFAQIKANLEDMSMAIDSLKLWLEEQMNK